ncbi:MAG: sensor histidine kinase, partial [Mycobacterium sp.]
LAGMFVIRRALAPLTRVAAVAGEVANLPLDRGEVGLPVRIPQPDANPGTEVGRLGLAVNRMLDHIATALSTRQASESRVRQFVADASHELRTPLAAIRGYTELAQRKRADVPDDVAHAMSRVESEAERMTRLVEDLLLLARLDSGRPLEHQPVDLSRLCADGISDAHIAGPEHRWNLEVPAEPVLVDGDDARLQQVVTNLLANARVHTPPGTTVTLALHDEACAAVVRVIDDGPGIPVEMQSEVFERFARADSSRSHRDGSTGLGLAIVQAVVRAHGGTIDLQSAPARTVFTVRLPRGLTA